jgi:putative membrane protein
MWWPIFCPLPEWNKLGELFKIGLIFGNGLLLTPVCALIIFANKTLYTSYMGVPQLFAILPPLDDQQLGGVIMKGVQELTYITVIGIIFFQWARKEKIEEVKR